MAVLPSRWHGVPHWRGKSLEQGPGPPSCIPSVVAEHLGLCFLYQFSSLNLTFEFTSSTSHLLLSLSIKERKGPKRGNVGNSSRLLCCTTCWLYCQTCCDFCLKVTPAPLHPFPRRPQHYPSVSRNHFLFLILAGEGSRNIAKQYSGVKLDKEGDAQVENLGSFFSQLLFRRS